MDAYDVAGRESELETIAAFVDVLGDGPAALWIDGEPGIGKTTLWEAALAFARQDGLPVLASRPAAAEAGLTFAALGDVLADVDAALYEQLPEPQRHALAAALLLEAPPRRRPVDQRAVGVALLGVLRALQPVVVAVDDAQWADPSSAAVVTFAWRRLRDERVGLLLATRSDGPSLFNLDGVRPHVPVRRIQLGPLGVGELHRAIRARLGLSLPRTTLLPKEKRTSRTTLEQAVAAFDDLGAPVWAAKARASMARISGRTTTQRDELTPTERRVAELVAEGRTNKEVAAALFVALRTVEWNLSKVYAKLGVRSRTELARKLAAERAPDLQS